MKSHCIKITSYQTGCSFGASPSGPAVVHTAPGNYLDLHHPALCPGNLTAWQFCHYPQEYSIDSDAYTYRAYFRIWRPDDNNVMYTLIYELEELIVLEPTGIPQQQFVCVDVTPGSDIVPIERGDIIGVLVPSRLTVSIPGIVMIANTSEGYGLFRDTRPLLLENRVVRDTELEEEPTLALHLQAYVTFGMITLIILLWIWILRIPFILDSTHSQIALVHMYVLLCLSLVSSSAFIVYNNYSDIDECEQDSVECGSNAQCVDTDGRYTCVCNPGYIRDDLVGCLSELNSVLIKCIYIYHWY